MRNPTTHLGGGGLPAATVRMCITRAGTSSARTRHVQQAAPRRTARTSAAATAAGSAAAGDDELVHISSLVWHKAVRKRCAARTGDGGGGHGGGGLGGGGLRTRGEWSAIYEDENRSSTQQ
jgi:hypothetical protein